MGQPCEAAGGSKRCRLPVRIIYDTGWREGRMEAGVRSSNTSSPTRSGLVIIIIRHLLPRGCTRRRYQPEQPLSPRRGCVHTSIYSRRACVHLHNQPIDTSISWWRECVHLTNKPIHTSMSLWRGCVHIHNQPIYTSISWWRGCVHLYTQPIHVNLPAEGVRTHIQPAYTRPSPGGGGAYTYTASVYTPMSPWRGCVHMN